MVVKGISSSSTQPSSVIARLAGEDPVPVPVGQGHALVGDEGVVLGSQRADLEDVGVAPVVVCVERDDDAVVLVDAPAPMQDAAADQPGLGIMEDEAEVECVFVVADAHLGRLAGGRPVHRVALAEVGHRLDHGPEGLVEDPVDGGRAGHGRRGRPHFGQGALCGDRRGVHKSGQHCDRQRGQQRRRGRQHSRPRTRRARGREDCGPGVRPGPARVHPAEPSRVSCTGPRIQRPGFSPVTSPSRITGTPFTSRWLMPSLYWWGSV